MYASIIFLLLSLAASGYSTPSNYVYSDKDAPAGAYPFMVAIKHKGKFMCAGTIIDKRNILTSGHCAGSTCIFNKKKDITIHAGTNLLTAEAIVYKVHDCTRHVKGSVVAEYKDYDIGLVTVDKDIVFTKNIQPIKYATKNEDYKNKTVTLLGWGSRTPDGPINERLQEVTLNAVLQQNCELVYLNMLSDRQMCAWRAGTALCNADSGVPLILDGVQIGIATFIPTCADDYPNVFMRVGHFANWIEEYKSNSGNLAVVSTLLLLLPILSILVS